MYLLLIAIVALWICSLYSFARWRYHSCLNRGVELESVLHDRLTQLFHMFATGIALALIVYII